MSCRRLAELLLERGIARTKSQNSSLFHDDGSYTRYEFSINTTPSIAETLEHLRHEFELPMEEELEQVTSVKTS